MNTQDLIGLLASDPLPAQAPSRRQLPVALLVGGLVCTGLMLVLWGINPDMDELATHPAFVTKMLWLIALMAFSVDGLQRLARPGMKAGHTGWGLGLSMLAMVSLGWIQTLQTPAGERNAQWLGSSWQVCSSSIAALALPVLAALLWALHQLAPTRPTLTGAVAGVMAGSLAASVYSLHCTETSFAFYSAWYVGGIAAVGLLGALLGTRFLRW